MPSRSRSRRSTTTRRARGTTAAWRARPPRGRGSDGRRARNEKSASAPVIGSGERLPDRDICRRPRSANKQERMRGLSPAWVPDNTWAEPLAASIRVAVSPASCRRAGSPGAGPPDGSLRPRSGGRSGQRRRGAGPSWQGGVGSSARGAVGGGGAGKAGSSRRGRGALPGAGLRGPTAWPTPCRDPGASRAPPAAPEAGDAPPCPGDALRPVGAPGARGVDAGAPRCRAGGRAGRRERAG